MRELTWIMPLLAAERPPYICGSEASPWMPHRGSRARLGLRSCQKTAAAVPDWGGRPCRGGTDGFREVYRPRQGFRPGGAEPGAARGPPAVRHRAPPEGAARRPGGHGRRPDPARRRHGRATRWPPIERALAKRPKVSGGGAGQVYLAPELARVFDTAEKIADKAGDKFVTVERLLLALGHGAVATRAARSRTPASTPTTLNQAINDIRKGRTADSASAEQAYDALEALCPRPHRSRRRGQDRSGHRPRRGDPPHHPGAVAAHQEQSRADRRARRRQDRHRRRPGPAHRQGRRAREPQGQEAAGARHGRADRRRQVSRRVRGAPEGRAVGGAGRGRQASSCSSTSCTPSSAPARPRARWMPATC